MILLLAPYVAQVHTDNNEIRGFRVVHSGQQPLAGLRNTVSVADAVVYLGIAQNGYERVPFDATTIHNWVLFPLYPLAVRLAAKLTGEFVLTGVALSNLFFFFALILLHKTTLRFGFDEAVADRTIFYVAAFPTSYFYSVPMAESLFLMLTVGAFYAAKNDQQLWAGISGGLASATRVLGIALLPSLALGCWEWHRDRLGRNLLFLFLVPIGLLIFMVHLGHVTGDPLAFKDIQPAFGRSAHLGFFLLPLIQFIFHPVVFSTWNLYPLHFAAAILTFIAAALLAKWRSWSLAFYTAASILVPLSTLSLGALTRYLMVVFPVFIVLAKTVRSRWSDLTVTVVFVSLLVFMTTCYAAHFGIALM